MSPRARPPGCCRPSPVPALPARHRERIVGALKALADPHRLEVFRLVSAQPEPVCVCDIVDAFELSQPTISHHLRVLREAGLLQTSKTGVWAFYSPEPGVESLLAELAELGRAA